jgi:hypothetical protein
MAPSAKHRGCTICGSPDAACGGHTATGVAVIQIPQSSPKFSGPVVEAMRPGPNGPYRVQARQDEAEAKGWDIITVTAEPATGLPEELQDQATAEPGFWSRLLGG